MRVYIQNGDLMTTEETVNDYEPISQDSVNDYLKANGLDPKIAVYEDLKQELLALMPRFLLGGGSYRDEEEGEVILSGTYPQPRMLVSYDRAMSVKWIVLSKAMSGGYPAIRLRVPNQYGFASWEGILVHPSNLDAIVCDLFGIQYKRSSL